MVFLGPWLSITLMLYASLSYALPDELDIESALESVEPIDYQEACLEVDAPTPVTSLLAIDGGGVRGIIPAYVLSYVEARAGKRVAELFEVVAGTSTGALIGAFLGAADTPEEQRSAHQLANDYLHESAQLFKSDLWRDLSTGFGIFGPKFDHRPIEDLLQRGLGEKRLSETVVRLIILSFDLMTNRAVIFDSANAKRHPSQDYLLKDVIRSATAAPVLFAPHKHTNIDGSVSIAGVDGAIFENSPDILALDTLYDTNDEGDVVILSLGTGIQTLPIVDSDDSLGFWDWKNAFYLVGIYGGTSVSDHLVNNLRTRYHQDDWIFLRLNLDVEAANLHAFDGSIANMRSVLEAAAELVDSNRDEIDNLILRIVCAPER